MNQTVENNKSKGLNFTTVANLQPFKPALINIKSCFTCKQNSIMGNKNQSSPMFRIRTGLESCTLMLAFKCKLTGPKGDNMSKNCYHRLLGQFSSPITASPQEILQFSKENMALEPHQNHEPFNHFDDFNNVRLLHCNSCCKWGKYGTCSMRNKPKLKRRKGWFLPKAIVATGHDQRAVSVEMNLRVKIHQHTPNTSHGHHGHLFLLPNLRPRQGRNEPATFSSISRFSRPISSRSRQTGGKEKQTLSGVSQSPAASDICFPFSTRSTPTLTDPDTMRLDWGLKLQQKT